MRIISGKFRGRKLAKSDHLKSLRPTTDKNRESLFNILSFNKFGFELRDSNILDLCCGSGAIGFEALSRGAKSVTFVDNNREHLELVKKNSAILGVENEAEIVCADARNFAKTQNIFDLIFIDPPYHQDCESIIKNLLGNSLIAEKTLVVVEAKELPQILLQTIEIRSYGLTKFFFLKKILVKSQDQLTKK